MEESTVVVATEPVTEAKKPRAKPAAKLKQAEPKVKVKIDAKAKDRSMADVPASEQRQAFLKLLRKHKADKPLSAMPISKIAEKLGYTHYNVYCLGYHKRPLAVGGYVKSVKLEDAKELSFHLTAKGVKSGPDDAK